MRKKFKTVYVDPPPDWQTVYCSLVIILVALFVMMSSYATLESGKVVEIARSFRGALDIFPGGVLFEKGESVVVPSSDEIGIAQSKYAAPIYQLLRGRGLETKVSLTSTSEYVSLTIMDSVLFDVGSAVISEEAKPLLAKIALILGGFSVPIRVEGHTDDRGDGAANSADNWNLSALRAVNVVRFLQDRGRVAPERLSAVGFAQYRPFLPNRSDDERRRNRRVEIIIPVLQSYFDERDMTTKDIPPSFKVWDLTG